MKHVTSLLLCLICWLPLGISGTPENGPERVQSEFSCNLPGPSDLNTSNITTNSFDLDWTAVPGAWGYRVRVTDSNNNQVFDNTTTGTAMFVNGMQAGETYTATVTTLCAVGNEGGSTSASVNTNIHIDIVAGSYECPNSSFATKSVPPVNSPDQLRIPFQRDVEYLAEYKIGEKSTFFTIITRYEGLLNTTLTQQNPGGAGDLTVNNTNYPIWPPHAPIYQAPQAVIGYHENEQSLVRITVINGDAGGADIDTIIVQNIAALETSLFDITLCKSSGPRGSDANYDLILNEQDILIYPNPFSEQIQIQSNDDIININLFNTNGKQIDIDQVSTIDQRRIEINTAKMVSGVYFLRINTKTGTSFRKIVKI